MSEKGLKEAQKSSFLPHISLDCVIFGFHERVLNVLLLRMKGMNKWALPGGFVHDNEHLDTAAERVLRERTSLEKIFLQQFFVFGDPKRVDDDFKAKVFDALDLSVSEKERLTQRHISVGYYALVSFPKVKPVPDAISEECTWHSFENIPELMLDHKQILNKAMETLRLQLNYQPIGYNLLPEKFTMMELQTLYEVILNKKLDRRNFQKRVLTFGILDRLDEIKKGVAHKAPFLYSFNQDKYQQALKEGLQKGW